MFKSVYHLCLSVVTAFHALTQSPQFDLLIKNGRIVDGSGAPAYNADLAIKGDRIVSIGDLSQAPLRARSMRKVSSSRLVSSTCWANRKPIC